MVTKVVVVSHGVYTLQNAYNELLQTFFTNKWYKGTSQHHSKFRKSHFYTFAVHYSKHQSLSLSEQAHCPKAHRNEG